jgi:hypothetical protein
MMTNTTTQNFIFKLQVVALLVMVAGWGWSDGNFTPPDQPLNTLLHCIPLVLLTVFGLQFFSAHDAHQRGVRAANWGYIGLSIVAIVSIIGAIVMITLGVVNPDPNSVGVHNFADWFPTIILNMGTFLWLGTMLPARRKHEVASVASN